MTASKETTPFAVRGVQDDGLYQAADALKLSRETSSFALRECGSAQTFAFLGKVGAPRAEFDDYGTWEAFAIGNTGGTYTWCEYEVPWYHQHSQWAIEVQIRVVTTTIIPLLLRVTSRELTAQTNSEVGKASEAKMWARPPGEEWLREESYGVSNRQTLLGQAICFIEEPDVAGGRILSLYPEAQLVGESGVGALQIGGSEEAYIESMVVRDIPNPDLYG